MMTDFLFWRFQGCLSVCRTEEFVHPDQHEALKCSSSQPMKPQGLLMVNLFSYGLPCLNLPTASIARPMLPHLHTTPDLPPTGSPLASRVAVAKRVNSSGGYVAVVSPSTSGLVAQEQPRLRCRRPGGTAHARGGCSGPIVPW